MRKTCHSLLASLCLLIGVTVSSWATPSSIIYIPSTDVQAPNTNHLGFDGYFSFDTPAAGTITDLGYTRGFNGRFELGIDHIGSQDDPILGHAKWQLLAPSAKRPAVAIGAYNWGGKKNILAGNLLYGLVSQTFGNAGRFSIGY